MRMGEGLRSGQTHPALAGTRRPGRPGGGGSPRVPGRL